MKRRKPADVRKRMGIYKRIEDVPDRSRLGQFEDRFENVDVWDAFATTRNSTFDSETYQATIRKAGSSFKSHMEVRGRHHALASPADIETWLDELAESRLLTTVYSEYWIRIEEFYTWLQRHPDYPHVYHPVWMAAATYPIAGALWEMKTKTNCSHQETR